MKVFYYIKNSFEFGIDEVIITFIAAENLSEAEKIAVENKIISKEYLEWAKSRFEPLTEFENVSYCGKAGVIETVIH